MSYPPSLEKILNLSMESERSPAVAKVDQLRSGYSYAYIGSALSMIAEGTHVGVESETKNPLITKLSEELHMWSGADDAGGRFGGGRRLTLVYRETFDEKLDKPALSMLWLTYPTTYGSKHSYLFTRDNQHQPLAHRYTSKKGWHYPSVRALNRTFHRIVSPIERSNHIVGRYDLFRERDKVFFEESMNRFEAD